MVHCSGITRQAALSDPRLQWLSWVETSCIVGATLAVALVGTHRLLALNLMSMGRNALRPTVLHPALTHLLTKASHQATK